MSSKLSLIVMNNFKSFGEKVNFELKKLSGSETDYIIPIEQVRFGNGEGKVIIKESVRDSSLFILSDVGNHSCTYPMYDYENHMSPDDHFQDIKRVISATCGSTDRMTLITPLLYESRQHSRTQRESLDCAMGLEELEALKIRTMVTFDAHYPSIQNTNHNWSFNNFMPTNLLLDHFLDNEQFSINNLSVISPDTGAVDRARNYSDILNSEIGIFNKRRDLNAFVDGRCPIRAHEYKGESVYGKDIIIVDDIIASGDSMLDVIEALKKDGANNIFIFCTFALFTKGIQRLQGAYDKGYFTKLYTTNLTYVPESISNKKWLVKVDFAPFVANIINTLYNHEPVSPLMNGKEKILAKVQQHQKA